MRHVSRDVGGVRAIAGEQIPGPIGQPDLIDQLVALRTPAAFDCGADLVEVRGNAVMHGEALIGFGPVTSAKLVVHIGDGGVDLVPPFKRLDDQLRAQRDNDAKHNDRDFTDELAPTVKWFGKMKVHAVSPRSRERNRRAYVGNGWKADFS